MNEATHPCHCESSPYKAELDSGALGNPKKVDCVCDVLDAYVDFASEIKKSDEDVDQLFNKTRHLLPAAIACQALRIEKLAKYSVGKTETRDRIISLSNWVKHIDEPDMKNLNTLLDMARSKTFRSIKGMKGERTLHGLHLESASRMDKVLFIEKFIDMAHGSGSLLDCACDYEVEHETQLGPSMTSVLTRHVLDCLKAIPANPDQVMLRMRNKEL